MATRVELSDFNLLRGGRRSTRRDLSSSLAIVRRPEGSSFERLMDIVDTRLADAPRYRQRITSVPLNLGRPVWVDDVDFDLTFHVRRSALPSPGGLSELSELVARLMDSPLDPTRPLWEMYLVEGLEGGRMAIFTKSHHVLVNGREAVDLAQLLLSEEPIDYSVEEIPTWAPSPTPSSGVLVIDAVASWVSDPADLWRRSTKISRIADSLVRNAVSTVVAPWTNSNREVGVLARATNGASRLGLASFALARVREVARVHDCAVNDVVLAVLCGVLRSWLLGRGQVLATGDVVRAMVPVSVRPALADVPVDVFGEQESGNRGAVASFVISMPVGEPNPRMRLAQISREARSHRRLRPAVSARSLTTMAGFAPPTLHALGARAARLVPSDQYDIVVTNAPGTQHRIYCADGQLDQIYPVPSLDEGRALSIGLTSYDGVLYCGMAADREVMPDIHDLGEMLDAAIDDLSGGSTSVP